MSRATKLPAKFMDSISEELEVYFTLYIVTWGNLDLGVTRTYGNIPVKVNT